MIRDLPPSGETGLRPATHDDFELLLPACAAAHEQELGVDPMRRDAGGLPLAHALVRSRRGDPGSGRRTATILFKAEASAWTPSAVQLQQVWVDPLVRRARIRRTRAARPLPPAARWVPAVCLFVRAENVPAIRLYEAIGMEHVLDYRSVLL